MAEVYQELALLKPEAHFIETTQILFACCGEAPDSSTVVITSNDDYGVIHYFKGAFHSAKIDEESSDPRGRFYQQYLHYDELGNFIHTTVEYPSFRNRSSQKVWSKPADADSFDRFKARFKVFTIQNVGDFMPEVIPEPTPARARLAVNKLLGKVPIKARLNLL